MSLRTKVIRLAYMNPGSLQKALLPLLKSATVKYEVLIPYLERLFPRDDPKRLVGLLKPGKSWSDYLTDYVLDNLNISDIKTQGTESDEYVQVVGHGGSPYAKEYYLQYSWPSKVHVKAEARFSTKDMENILDALSPHRPDRQALREVIQDRQFQRIMAKAMKEAIDISEWWLNLEDEIRDEINDEILSDKGINITTNLVTGGPSTIGVSPNGRGGYVVAIKGGFYLEAEAFPST